MDSLRILSIAVIGKHNQPLFLQAYNAGSDELRWQYAAHASLDYFEERDNAKQTEPYLGLLYVMEDYAVYGYQSTTRIRFVLIIALVDAVIRDPDIKLIFKAIHNAYISFVANPFSDVEEENQATLAQPIKSKAFAKKLSAIVGANAVPV